MSRSGSTAQDGVLRGEKTILHSSDKRFPAALRRIPEPPEALYVVGNVGALVEGLAVVGARRATPYGKGCARRFAGAAAERGVTIISGGAYGCDAQAHRAALEKGCPTVVFLGGGCDRPYPVEHVSLFQQIVDAGGAVVSEYEWGAPALPYRFRRRNRLIAGLARATLIVEAGIPSGTFSTADEALSAGKDVLVVPGSITSPSSKGANRLLYQGAVPVVDDESFADALFDLFGCLKIDIQRRGRDADIRAYPLLEPLLLEPMSTETLYRKAVCSDGGKDVRVRLMEQLARAQNEGAVARCADGKWSVSVDG